MGLRLSQISAGGTMSVVRTLITTTIEKNSRSMMPRARPRLATIKPTSPRGTIPIPIIATDRGPIPMPPAPAPNNLATIATNVMIKAWPMIWRSRNRPGFTCVPMMMKKNGTKNS